MDAKHKAGKAEALDGHIIKHVMGMSMSMSMSMNTAQVCCAVPIQ
jgi:hypothetical protein